MSTLVPFTLERIQELSLERPIEMLALLKKVAADVMASDDAKKEGDMKKRAEMVCLKILEMLDDAEKAGKAYLEVSIEKEKTIAVLAVVSQLKDLVKNHLPTILCPPPFVRQIVSRVLALFSGCFSKSAVSALPPVQIDLPPVASPLSSDVAAVETHLAVREPLPVAEGDPVPASADTKAEEKK
jgi:hypothetical protein